MTEQANVAWQRQQATAMNVAYRMLGSLADAQDVVQEVWLRMARTDLDDISDLEGWTVTVTARLCLDHLKSAAVARRSYPGPWLPDPLVSLPDTAPTPADRVTLDDSVRVALLVVLQKLSPPERTAFLLHDVFGLSFAEVAETVGRSDTACRKLAAGRALTWPRTPIASAWTPHNTER